MPESRDWNERYATKNTPWDSGVPSLELQRVLRERDIKPCRTLDIGCGTGTNAVFLAQRGFDVLGVDVSPLAIEQARAKARAAAVNARFEVADLLGMPALGPPFDFVFDRGVYHCVRTVNLEAFLRTMSRATRAGTLYSLLAGNANEQSTGEGPPRVKAEEICAELCGLFELVELREARFHGVVIEGKTVEPLAWAALLRRRE